MPSYQYFAADDYVRGGATGTFSVNTSDLVAGTTILVSTIVQSTDSTWGESVPFNDEGKPVNISTNTGKPVGTLQFDPNSPWGSALTLSVTNTIPGNSTTFFKFTGEWMYYIAYQTSATTMHTMPFTSTFTTGKNQTGATNHAYSIEFAAPKPTYKATELAGDMFNLRLADTITVNDHMRKNLLTDTTFRDIQTPTLTIGPGNKPGVGTTPNIKGRDIIRNTNIYTSQTVVPTKATVYLGTFYVSNDYAQTTPGDKNEADTVESDITKAIPVVNAGDGIYAKELDAKVKKLTSSAMYYSRQDDGSIMTSTIIKAADQVLTDVQIDQNTRSTYHASAAAYSKNREADVTSTRNYYHKYLNSYASNIGIYEYFTPANTNKTTSVDAFSLDSSAPDANNTCAGGMTGSTCTSHTVGSVLKKVSGSTPSTGSSSSGQTTVATHHLNLDGTSAAPDSQTVSFPTGKTNSVTGSKGTATAANTPASIPGYRPLTSTDLSSLTDAQRQTIATTLGASNSSVAGLTALANNTDANSIWATGNLSVPYPGETGLSYNANGDIVAFGTAGSTAGWGTTDVYYFYIPANQTITVQYLKVPDTCAPANNDWASCAGSQPVTQYQQSFTNQPGTPVHETLNYTDKLFGPDRAVGLPAEVSVSEGSDSAKTRTFTLNTTIPSSDTTLTIYLKNNQVKKDAGVKTITRTIHHQYPDGSTAAPDTLQTSTWKEDLFYDVIYPNQPPQHYNNWHNTDITAFDAVTPSKPGYLTNPRTVTSITGITQDGRTDNPSVTFAATDPANPNTSNRKLDVTVIYQRAITRMPFTGGTGVIIGGIIALALLALAALLTHLRNKRTNQ